jgi:hypothetical protein
MSDKQLFSDILKDICAADERKRPRIIAKAAEEFDEAVLGHSRIPQQVFDFLIEIISCPEVASSRGVEHFLLEVNVDFCKYTSDQQAALLETLLQNGGSFVDQLSRHSIGDFIARAYLPEVAFSALKKFSKGGETEQQIAFSGFDVLRKRIDANSPMHGRLTKEWRILLNK